jgi:hypothetical protein
MGRTERCASQSLIADERSSSSRQPGRAPARLDGKGSSSSRSTVLPLNTAQEPGRRDRTQPALPESGTYVVPGALVPIEIDRERDEGVYVEPNVWMVHSPPLATEP